MASYLEHCKECRQKIGDDFGKVHKWLDEYFVRLNFDVKHRDVRHHEDGIEEVRKMWGDKAAEAARLHIATDFHGYVPKNSQAVQEWRMGVVPTPGLENKGGILIPTKK